MLNFLLGSTSLVAACVFFFFYKQLERNGKVNRHNKGWIIPFGLLFTAMCLAGASYPGRWIGSVVYGIIGVKAVTLIVICLFVAALCDLVDGKPDKIAKVAVFAVPLLAFYANGSFAHLINELVNGTQQSGQNIVTKIGG